MQNPNSIGAGEIQPVEVIRNAEVLGREFQIYGTEEYPLFKAKDVADCLGIQNVSQFLKDVDEDEKGIFLIYTPGGEQQSWCLTENGLYEVLMLSRKPIAKEFKKKVKEILHEIRTNGAYVHAAPSESLEELTKRALQGLNAAIERQKLQLAEQRKQLELQAPDVEYCQEVLSANNLHTVNSIATHLGISAMRLNKFLIDEDWIYKQGQIYYPSSKIRGKNYADFHVIPYVNRDGETLTREHLKWTGSGRRAIIELWNKKKMQSA